MIEKIRQRMKKVMKTMEEKRMTKTTRIADGLSSTVKKFPLFTSILDLKLLHLQ
jgi:hypothetical protein